MQSLPPKKQITAQDLSEGMKCVFRYLTTKKAIVEWSDKTTLPVVKSELMKLEAEVASVQT